MTHTLPTFCGKDCGGDACPLSAVLEEGRVTRIINNPAGGKYLRGCWRGHHQLDAHNAPDRLLHPLVRVGPRGSGQFRRASWDEALERIAAALTQVRSQHGPQAVLSLASAGCTGALHGTHDLLTRFLHLFGGCTELTNNYSNGAASFVLPYLSDIPFVFLFVAVMACSLSAGLLTWSLAGSLFQHFLNRHYRAVNIVMAAVLLQSMVGLLLN